MKIINETTITPEVLNRLKSHVYDIIGCCIDVHRELGPWLNEYIYQEALKVALEEKQIPYEKEFLFRVSYHGHPLDHKHYIDFLCKGNVVVECKAITAIGVEQRQQLWNYMRLTNTQHSSNKFGSALIVIYLGRDSAKLKQVWLCTHCSLGSVFGVFLFESFTIRKDRSC